MCIFVYLTAISLTHSSAFVCLQWMDEAVPEPEANFLVCRFVTRNIH